MKEIMYNEDGEPTGIVFTAPRVEVRVSIIGRITEAYIDFDQYFRSKFEGEMEKLKFSLTIFTPEPPPFLLSKAEAENATLDEVLEFLDKQISVYMKTIAVEGKKSLFK